MGASDGASLGEAEGASVGASEGELLGALDGASLGEFVGASVGASLGASVWTERECDLVPEPEPVVPVVVPLVPVVRVLVSRISLERPLPIRAPLIRRRQCDRVAEVKMGAALSPVVATPWTCLSFIA